MAGVDLLAPRAPAAGGADLLRRPDASPQATPAPAQMGSGYEVDILGRRYRLQVPSQEIADQVADSVRQGVSQMRPPDQTAPRVPNEDPVTGQEATWDEMLTAAIEDRLGRETAQTIRANRPLVSKIGDWTRDLVQGVTMGAGDEIIAGIDHLIPGGMNFDQRLAWEREQMAAHRAENPVASLATEMVGGLPLLATPGALPRAGASFGTNVARSAANAAGIGAAYGFNTAEGGIEDRLAGAGTGVGIGAATGAGIPVLGRLVAPATNLASMVLPNVRGAAAAQRSVSTALRESNQTPAGIAGQMARNPELMALDVDPNLMSRAQGIAAQPGAGRSILSREVSARQADRGMRVNDIFDQSMGATPDVQQELARMTATAQVNAQQGFGQALGNAGPADVGGIISSLQQRIYPGGLPGMQQGRPLTARQQELARVLDQLTNSGRGQVVDVQALHELQSQLRREAEALGNSASGGDRLIAGDLREVRQQIIDAIDEAAGGPPQGATKPGGPPAAAGPYRAAQRQYADDMAVEDAFYRGFDILQNPTSGEAGMQARSEFWKSWAGGLSVPEREAAQLGARAAFDTALSSVRNAAARGAAIPEVGNVRDRLTFLFGPQEADRMTALLADERLMASNYNDILRGSQTAARTQGADAVSVRSATTGRGLAASGALGAGAAFMAGGGNLLPAAGLAAASGVAGGVRFLGRLTDQARNAELARILSARGQQGQQAMAGINGSPILGQLLRQPNRFAELGLAPARTAVPALMNR